MFYEPLPSRTFVRCEDLGARMGANRAPRRGRGRELHAQLCQHLGTLLDEQGAVLREHVPDGLDAEAVPVDTLPGS